MIIEDTGMLLTNCSFLDERYVRLALLVRVYRKIGSSIGNWVSYALNKYTQVGNIESGHKRKGE